MSIPTPIPDGLITAGRTKLGAWLADPQHSQSALAAELRINQSSVSLWVRGRSRPESYLRDCLSLIIGIASHEWDTEDERALVEHVRAKFAPLVEVPAKTSSRPPRKRSGTTTRAVSTPARRTA